MSIKYNNFFNYLFYLIYKNIKSKFYYPKDWYILESTGPIVFTKAMIMYLNNTKTNGKNRTATLLSPSITDFTWSKIKS